AAARGGGSSAGGGGLSGSAGASARGAQLAGGGLGQAAGARSRFYGLIFGPAKMILKLCAACVCFALLFKMLGKIDCASKKMDPRRWCKCCARQLMAMGWDEFESFDASVRVHSVADIANKGMLGGEKEFRVTIRFKWSKFDTPPTRDMKWESIKTMEVPQGAHECTIALYSLGKFRDTCLGKIELETKKDMIDKPDFWGKKQKFKLEKSGKEIGKILITFYKKGDGDGDDDGEGGGSMPEVPVDGVDSDSALALEIQLAIEELEKVPGFVKPAGKWEGQNKIIMLARVLEGQLREVNKKGKETGKVYIAIRYCNISELFGDEDNRREELKRQKEKAKQKGLPEVEKKKKKKQRVQRRAKRPARAAGSRRGAEEVVLGLVRRQEVCQGRQGLAPPRGVLPDDGHHLRPQLSRAVGPVHHQVFQRWREGLAHIPPRVRQGPRRVDRGHRHVFPGGSQHGEGTERQAQCGGGCSEADAGTAPAVRRAGGHASDHGAVDGLDGGVQAEQLQRGPDQEVPRGAVRAAPEGGEAGGERAKAEAEGEAVTAARLRRRPPLHRGPRAAGALRRAPPPAPCLGRRAGGRSSGPPPGGGDLRSLCLAGGPPPGWSPLALRRCPPSSLPRASLRRHRPTSAAPPSSSSS
ncbi:unnamed protein product, partial [Prorocentrum cordatum]